MNVKYVDGLIEQLKGLEPLADTTPKTIYECMQDKSLTPRQLGQLVHAMHEYREVTKDIMGDDQLAPQKATQILFREGSTDVTFSLVDRAPQADGTFSTYARITLEKDAKGGWGLTRFTTSLDPSGYDKDMAQQYVDMADQIRGAYKNTDKFGADFLQALTQGEFMWDAMMKADYMGRADTMFEKACKEEQQRRQDGGAPMRIMKIEQGRLPGTFDFSGRGETRDQNRVAVAPVQNRRP